MHRDSRQNRDARARRFRSVLFAGAPQIEPIAGRSTGRRLALARWIASTDNPLTPRVMVNRVWQQHFGRGLVTSSGDFGRQGEPPTHPALLRLAGLGVGSGRISSQAAAPLDHDLGRVRAARRYSPAQSCRRQIRTTRFIRDSSMRRLTAEQLRDAMLATSGELNLANGRTERSQRIARGISAAYAWKPDDDPRSAIVARFTCWCGAKLARAAIGSVRYARHARDLYAASGNDDGAAGPVSAGMPSGRSIGLGAARRVEATSPADGERAIRTAYRIVFQRETGADELQSGTEFLRRSPVKTDAARDKADVPATGGVDHQMLVGLCHVLLNSNEFLYVD